MSVIHANVPGRGFCKIVVDQGKIRSCEVLGTERHDALYCWSGLVDLQVNGFAGVDFNVATHEPAELASLLQPLFSTGVTTFLPTLITNRPDTLSTELRLLEEARRRYPLFASAVPGYHLEGPWLSPGPSHGAHSPEFMRLPDWHEFEELQAAAGGRIRLITVAPELPGIPEFVRRARAQGVAVAIGHTDGSREDVYRAADAGAALCTHLGNGCPQTLDRHSSPFWAQLADDRLAASLICDLFHVTPEVIRIVARVKGLSKCCVVTDAMQAATMPPGAYKIADTEAELLSTGQVVRADRSSMAGSSLTMDRAVANFKRITGCSLVDALQTATKNPWGILGGPNAGDVFTPGAAADLILFEPKEDRICIQETILRGETVWRDGSECGPAVPAQLLP